MTDDRDETAKPLYARAREAEAAWREANGLGKRLHRKGRTRRPAVSPKGPDVAKQHRRWRERRLGKMGAASAVRRVDPATGEVIGS